MRWQFLQWQAMVTSGGALIRNRTWPQRQPPSEGNAGLLMIWSLPGPLALLPTW